MTVSFGQFAVGITAPVPSPASLAEFFAESSSPIPSARRSRDDDYAASGLSTSSSEKIRSSVPIPAFLPYYDQLQTAGETAEMREAYRRMLADPYIKAAFHKKILSVAATELSIKPPKKKRKSARHAKHAEFVDWNLKHGMHEGIPGMIWDIFSGGLIDGISVCEPIWGDPEEKGPWEGKRRLARLKAKDASQDLVVEIDAFKNITGIKGLRYNSGEVWNPRDFVIYTHLGLYENPVGMSDFRAAYRAYWLLDTVWKLRALAIDKRSMPIVVAHWKDPQHQSKLDAALAKIRYQNWLSVPEGAQVEAFDIAGQSHQIFSDAVRDLREEVTTSILGAILQTMTSQGQRGDSQVHKDTADLPSWHLCSAFCHLLNDHENGIIRRILDLNFSNVDEYPIASMGGVDDAELSESTRVDEALQRIVQPMGLQLDRDELEERYGRKFVEMPQPEGAVGPDGQPIPGAGGGMPGGAGPMGGGPGTGGPTNGGVPGTNGVVGGGAGGAGGPGGPVDDTDPTSGEQPSMSGLPWLDGVLGGDPADTSVADELSYDPTTERAATQAVMGGGGAGEGGGDGDEDFDGDDGAEAFADEFADAIGGGEGDGEGDDDEGDDGGDGGDEDDESAPDGDEDDWQEETEPTLFAESDWENRPGPRSKRRWVHVKTGKVVYADGNPGKAKERKAKGGTKAAPVPSERADFTFITADDPTEADIQLEIDEGREALRKPVHGMTKAALAKHLSNLNRTGGYNSERAVIDHGWATDGRFMFKVPDDERASFVDSNPGSGRVLKADMLKSIIDKTEKAEMKPATIVGKSNLDDNKTPVYSIESGDGKKGRFQAKFIDTIRKRYPNAELKLSVDLDSRFKTPTAAFVRDGEIIGVVVGLPDEEEIRKNEERRQAEAAERYRKQVEDAEKYRAAQKAIYEKQIAEAEKNIRDKKMISGDDLIELARKHLGDDYPLDWSQVGRIRKHINMVGDGMARTGYRRRKAGGNDTSVLAVRVYKMLHDKLTGKANEGADE